MSTAVQLPSHRERRNRLPPGQTVTVMVRPDDIRIAPAGTDKDGLRWSGQIAHTIFRGPTRSIVVEIEDGRLNVDASAFGDNVTVAVPQHAAWAVG